jgi:hypothetical protein
MGVDYYHCEVCGESRYEEYVGNCNKCGNSLCTSCLINKDFNDRYAHHYGYKFDSLNPELMKKYQDEGYCLYDSDGTPYYEDGEIISDSGIDSKYCPFCSGEKIDEALLFKHIVKKYNIDINKEWREVKKSK